MKRVRPNFVMTMLLIGAAAALGLMIFSRLQEQSGRAGSRQVLRSVPVAVAPIQRGPIELHRTFSGTLESPARLVVSPKISGRIEGLNVDLGDTVRRGQIVAELDDDEYVQAIILAKADIEVAKANLIEAKSALEIAGRKLKRFEMLRERRATSDSEFDLAQADHLGKLARLEVSKAQLTRAEASLETAKIRIGYTKVTAGWTGGDDYRVVADRYVDEGETVSANAPLLSIVEVDPIIGVIFVTEKDYIHLKRGQAAMLTTDAYPGKQFKGRISRIAPVFRKTTRQAKIELTINNPQQRLKPGMFIRTTVVLDRIADATIVPGQALTTRDDKDGIFVVNDNRQSVAWREVKVGIREGNRVQVEGEGLSGYVVTLGQQLIEDGSKITIPGDRNKTDSTRKEAPRK